MRRAVLLALAAVLLSAQDFSHVTFEPLAKGLTYAEGPAWSREGYLVFSDPPSDVLYKWIPGHEAAVYRKDAHGPSGNAFDAEGRLYTCETRARRVTRTDKKGAVEVLADRFEGKRLNAPNDIVVARNGHAYFTDPAFGSQQDHRARFLRRLSPAPACAAAARRKAGWPAERRGAFPQRTSALRREFR